MPTKARAQPRSASRRAPGRPRRPQAGVRRRPVVPDGFYRDLVWNLRNGVLAITRDGRVAVMNDIAYGILGLKPRPTDIGRPFTEVLKDVPDVCRILAGAFELSHLPNRAELRLKNTGKVIGYTLSHVRDARGRVVGATLFFKDLTRVEQLEERERLRDRLAALGEMAAAIAHEVKNPLAGIEVMAGHPQAPAARRREDAQTDPRRHHQGSEDGQRHRARGARVRAADPAAGRAHRARRRRPRRDLDGRQPRAARETCEVAVDAARRRCRRSRAIRTSCGSCSRTC